MATSADLGEIREARLPQGTIRYRERGSGEPIVFVHGVLVNGDLWRKVVPLLAGSYRCITPDLPLGSHTVPMPSGADLSPAGLGRLVADLLETLGLERVTLVGNDTGGAICQLVVARHPERVGRLVLTPCDAFDNFPPAMFRVLFAGARLPGFLWLLGQTMRLRALRRLPLAYGWLAKRRIDPTVTDGWIAPLLRDAHVRADLERVLAGLSPEVTQAVARELHRFTGPVLIVWPRDTPFFPFAHARRLAEVFPNAWLEAIDDAYAFVPEDQPMLLADRMREWLVRPLPEHAAAPVS